MISKYEKLIKALDKETVDALSNSSADNLKAKIIFSEQAINTAKDELEANPVYQEIKANLKALSSGFRDVKKRQNAIIQLSLMLLEEK